MATGHPVLQTGAGGKYSLSFILNTWSWLFNRLCCSQFIMTFYYRLCYTEATIFEIQRLGSIAPQAVPHRTLGDVTGGSKKTHMACLIVYSELFCSQRIQDPKGHLCFLDALLHHEVTTSWSFLLLPSGNPYHTLLPTRKENLGIQKSQPKKAILIKSDWFDRFTQVQLATSNLTY